MLPWPGPRVAVDTLGRYFTNSSRVETFSSFSVSPVSAWMLMGTFCRFSERRWAVTTISSRPSDGSAAGACALAMPAPEAVRTAAIANDNVFFEFTRLSPLEGPVIKLSAHIGASDVMPSDVPTMAVLCVYSKLVFFHNW